MALVLRPRKTVDDYLRLPDEVRAELFEGEIFLMPAPTFRHQRTSGRLHYRMHGHVHAQKLGEIIPAPFDVVLSDEDVVQPDLVFVATEHLDRVRERMYGAPDVVVEILSPSHAERDRIVKRDLYRKHGVREYWMVDTDAETIEVLVLREGAWHLHGIFARSDTVTSPLLPGLSFPVAEIFE